MEVPAGLDDPRAREVVAWLDVFDRSQAERQLRKQGRPLPVPTGQPAGPVEPEEPAPFPDPLPEPKIIVRFWIVSFVLQVISLTTLKLR